jgi:hypothetical protein
VVALDGEAIDIARHLKSIAPGSGNDVSILKNQKLRLLSPTINVRDSPLTLAVLMNKPSRTVVRTQ